MGTNKTEKFNEKKIDTVLSKEMEFIKDKYIKYNRTVSITLYIFFFFAILSISIVTSILSKSILNIKEIFSSKIEIIISILGFLVSFFFGIFSSYYKLKNLNNATEFNIQDFIKNVYLDNIDKSNLNPHRN